MPYNPRGWRLRAALLAICLCPGIAAAQELPKSLRLPTIAASTAAAADWASTYHALKYYNLRETNPLLQSFQGEPGRLVTVGAAMDAAAFSAWNVTMGRRHPRIAAAGLWAMAGFRAYLVVHNLRNEQKVGRRESER
jgi:hypothetical protein